MAADDLETVQEAYTAAVEEWIATIRHEEALASSTTSIEEIDRWEEAESAEEEARAAVKKAKEALEGALREKFFNF